MSKELKRRMINDYKKAFSGYDRFIIVNYSGKSANDIAAIRQQLRRQEVKIKVVKNSLAKMAFKELGLEGLEAAINGPCAMCHGGEDIVELAKAVNNCMKGPGKIELKGGYYHGAVINIQDIRRLAAIPPREVLYAQLAGVICNPLTKLAVAMNELSARLARLFKALSEQKQSN